MEYKERKDCQIKVRITASQKEQIEKYCEANDMSVSEFLRMACDEVLNKKGDK